MDRESKRLIETRTAALLGTVLLHGLMIMWALSVNAFLPFATPSQTVQLLTIDRPPRLHRDEKLSALQMNWVRPDPSPLAMPDVNVPEEPPPPQAVASEETAPSIAAVVASDGAVSTSSNGSGNSSTDSGDIAVAHRVQPIYSNASVQAGEQGYVVAGLLIDEQGLVRKVRVVKSSGFRRLDQSVVDALRLWTFKRTDAALSSPMWAQFAYGFHIARSNAAELPSITLELLPYDAALAEQIRAAAVPADAQTRKDHGAAALRRLIAAIQTAAPTVPSDFQVQLVNKLGAVRSIQFIGLESHGLDVNTANKVTVANSQHSEESQWELYKVTQKGGTSDWLIDVTRSGLISSAQAIICKSDQDEMPGCP